SGVNSITRQLSVLAGVPGYSEELKLLDDRACEVTRPIRSFYLDLEGAATVEDPLAAVELGGYRYIILPENRSRREKWLFAEVDVDREDQESSAQIWREETAAILNDALNSEEVSEIAAEKDFEVAWLTIQSLDISCLWLRDLNGHDDRLVSFKEGTWEIEKRVPFVSRLSRRARERVKSGVVV
ncbi:MAG TPA: hypothetical protein VF179_13770, partial [Thermoanaerobaculia bacterium]|nr:hypothetical protein [Thermoanaerobaculia bacterium]